MSTFKMSKLRLREEGNLLGVEGMFVFVFWSPLTLHCIKDMKCWGKIRNRERTNILDSILGHLVLFPRERRSWNKVEVEYDYRGL